MHFNMMHKHLGDSNYEMLLNLIKGKFIYSNLLNP
jgi:hypothetical protein